ncbi:UDP-N-acetylglucosamine--N-acetylmuramyl-(pentapeptide) pyrophosphoryl-undecaprenol N-acetylglucosamine transferase [bioreactor metagenome]|uniref:UDP-N-acetylglucosamine--N-acetylmuramyl-(Pentapeptide) pyrophosphoryl-undecaprenol N-acetylglucosamine transferase n=1 Tax=bioreactor metagenome TaxID=1076179 RepID=A0A645F872_9ZZZZ
MKPKNPVTVTGLPVRGEMTLADRDISRAELGLDDKPMILSMGGSLGARTINEAMVELITRLHKQNKYNFVHAMGQYGLWVPDKLRENGVNIDHNKQIIIREYIDDMDRCMAACDLIICRAGASSLSEIQVMGKAAILIPSPNVAENHQYHNAMALVDNGAAMIIEEKDLNGDTLYHKVHEILDNPSVLKSLGENARKMAITDSKERICKILGEIVH